MFYTLSPMLQRLHKSVMAELCILMRDKLNHSLDFIFQCTVISSKMFFQFWREMKIQYCQVGSIWWVIQDSETNTLNICSSSCTCGCAVKHCHNEGETPPCEDEFFKVPHLVFPLFHSTTHELRMVPVGYAFNIPQSSKHDFANKHCSLNLFQCWLSFATQCH